MPERQIYYDCKRNETLRPCVSHEHGRAHHAGKPDGGAEQQYVLYAGDQRGIKRAECRVEPWAGVPRADQICQGQPRRGLHQAAAPRQKHPL